MSNRAYEKALKEHNDEHRFDDKEITVYKVLGKKFRNYDSAIDFCISNSYHRANIVEETYKVDWQGSRI